MKLSLANLQKVMDRCTKKEIDLLVYIGQFQDEYGVIKRIDYKDVLENAQVKKSTFYKLLYALEQKDIIKINYMNEHSFWEVTISDNVFASQEDYKKGYLKLNYEILHSDAFKKMTKSEKVIIFHLIKINDFRKEKIKVTFKKIADCTGKSMRSVKKFVQTLSGVLHIIVRDHLCFIDCLVGFSSRKKSETDTKNTHHIQYLSKKTKAEATECTIKDVCVMLKQYASIGVDRIYAVVENTMESFGEIVPAYINRVIRTLVE